jgi:hypothetical protein
MTAIVIAVIALIGSIGSAVMVAYGQIYTQRRTEAREADRLLRLYREPLISAAYDLQSRLYNILRQNFLSYLRDESSGRSEKALDSTTFAFAQYFGWREILRREIQLLEFETLEIGRLLSQITGTLASDSLGDRFLLWKPEQRAIGEAMIGEWRDGPACIGYLEFHQRRTELAAWIEPLERDLRAFAETNEDDARLVQVQHLLVSLIKALDPAHVRYAPERLELA